MSQHFITEFINRTYVFKPFRDAKIANHKVKKFQGSDRKNNISPETVAESTHALHRIEVKKATEDPPQENDGADKHIDIIV